MSGGGCLQGLVVRRKPARRCPHLSCGVLVLVWQEGQGTKGQGGPALYQERRPDFCGEHRPAHSPDGCSEDADASSSACHHLGHEVWMAFLLFDNLLERDPYVREPRDLKCVYPAVLCKILKSAYGLSEAPRPHTGELLRKCGFDEILWAPVTLIKRRSGKVVAILCLHVDDGFLGGQKGREMEEAKKDITALFSMKEWQARSYRE